MKKDFNYLREEHKHAPIPFTKVVLEYPSGPMPVRVEEDQHKKDIPQKVHVDNLEDIKLGVTVKAADVNVDTKPLAKEVSGLGKIILEGIKKLIPEPKDIQKVDVSSFPVDSLSKKIAKEILDGLPLGFKDKAGKADPNVYMNMRLTDGERFYRALDTMMAAMGGGGANGTIGNFPQTGQVRTATLNVPVPLSATPAKIINGVIIRALASNTGDIYIGAKGVSSSTGFPIVARESTSIAINDLANLYIVGAAGDGVSYITSN